MFFYNPLLSPFIKGEFDYVPYSPLLRENLITCLIPPPRKGGKGVVPFLIALPVECLNF